MPPNHGSWTPPNTIVLRVLAWGRTMKASKYNFLPFFCLRRIHGFRNLQRQWFNVFWLTAEPCLHAYCASNLTNTRSSRKLWIIERCIPKLAVDHRPKYKHLRMRKQECPRPEECDQHGQRMWPTRTRLRTNRYLASFHDVGDNICEVGNRASLPQMASKRKARTRTYTNFLLVQNKTESSIYAKQQTERIGEQLKGGCLRETAK